MGAYPHWFLWEGQVEFLDCCWCLFQVVGGDPHGFHEPVWKPSRFLRSLFARYGIPEEVASDNGPQLASEEFSQFLKQNGVKFTRVPPYHPASNGAAELSAQTAKKVLTKQVLDGKANSLSLEHRLANFIILNRSKPHTVTGQSPAELFLGRQIRNCFTLLKPNLNRAVDDQQLRQKEHHDEGRVKRREFKLTEVVLVSNWRRGVERWMPGRIAQVKGPRTYLVRCEDQIRFVHMDHLKSALWIESSSSWEGEEDSNYARNFPSSQAEVKSGAWSPSEPLIHPRQEEFRMQVTWGNRTQLRWHQNHHWEMLWREPFPQGHHCHRTQHWGIQAGRRDHHADSYVKCEHYLSRWRTLNIANLLDLHFLVAVVMLTNPFIREECNIRFQAPCIFHLRSTLKMED